MCLRRPDAVVLKRGLTAPGAPALLVFARSPIVSAHLRTHEGETMAERPSETVLEETPNRSLTFLRGIARYPQIQSLLVPYGYTPEQHDEGWRLLLAASGAPSTTVVSAPVTTPAHQAMTALDAWDERGFALIDAALEGFFPEQHAFVFAGGLAASVGAAAVIGVQTLLERLEALETGKDRPKASRKKDEAALARLSERGIAKGERDRLAGLVKQARSLEPTAAPVIDTKRQEALHALYLWYREWSKTARAVISKRAYLISLGLAKRKSPKKAASASAPAGEAAGKTEA